MYRILILFFCAFLVACQTQSNIQAAQLNVQLGLNYLKQNERVRAKQKLLLAVSQAPDFPEAQLAMGYFFLVTDEKPLAKKYYDQALNLAPESGQVQNNYGVFLCKTGRYKESIDHFLIATQDSSYLASADAYENAGLCALKIPDQKIAIYYFQQALKQEPNRQTSLWAIQKYGRKDRKNIAQ